MRLAFFAIAWVSGAGGVARPRRKNAGAEERKGGGRKRRRRSKGGRDAGLGESIFHVFPHCSGHPPGR